MRVCPDLSDFVFTLSFIFSRREAGCGGKVNDFCPLLFRAPFDFVVVNRVAANRLSLFESLSLPMINFLFVISSSGLFPLN